MNFLKSVYHYFLAWLGSVLYRAPSKDIFVLGVTGTNGKSTTIELVNAILEEDGKKTALSTSTRVKIGDTVTPQRGSMTMPGRFFLQRFLRQAVDMGCSYALIEVTSEGVRQHRHRFIHFDAALVTNVSPEHIESHGSFKRYLASKVRFFRSVAWRSKKKQKFFFVNALDEHKDAFLKVAKNGEVIEFSRERFKERVQDVEQISSWLATDFNLENAAAATAFTESQHISFGTVLQALSVFRGVPGRMEFIQKEPFGAVVDLALTPKALEGLYQALKKKYGSGNLICVLGAAGGGRDTWKRPELGKLAGNYCETIVITDDEPYDEDPESIRNEILSGITSKGKAQVIPDRKKAIMEAVQIAKSGDIVAVTGMGDLRTRHFAKGKKIHWSDAQAVEEALAKVRK